MKRATRRKDGIFMKRRKHGMREWAKGMIIAIAVAAFSSLWLTGVLHPWGCCW